MRIYHNQLNPTLNKGFKPIWLIFGDEPWQKINSLHTIKNHANQQGFSELIRFSADDKFDWQQVFDEYQSMSLFSSQRIIEIELVNDKVNEAGSKVLLTLLEHLHQDVLLIIHGGKLNAATTNKKWFKSLAEQGCYLPLYDIETKALTPWLKQQAKQLSLSLSPDVVTLLIELFEGNLLALEQELQKLSILFGDQVISLEAAENLVINQAKFNPFQLIDQLLLGNCTKCISIIDQLQQEGTAIGQLVWVIHKELQQLLAMLEKLAQGENLNALYKHYRIWDKRKPLYQQALTHMSITNLQHAIGRLAQLEILSKTSSDFNPFILLTDVCLTLYHGQTLSKYSLDYQ